jgi:hypothetical protein
MFSKNEMEQLRKNVLDENRVNKIFEIIRSKIDKMQQESRQLIFKYPDDPLVKEDVARTQWVDNGFDIIFDLLEVTMKNVLYQNQILSSLLQDSTQSGINKSAKEIREKNTDREDNNSNNEFIVMLKEHVEDIGETKKGR